MKTDGQRGESSPHPISLSTLYYSSLFQYDGHCGELLPHIRLYSLPSGGFIPIFSSGRWEELPSDHDLFPDPIYQR